MMVKAIDEALHVVMLRMVLERLLSKELHVYTNYIIRGCLVS